MGLLTCLLYDKNINAVLQDELSINLGTLYESAVAQELIAHGHKLHYYDNNKKGEVDFLVDDFSHLDVLPIEVKSGKDYKVHSALDNFLSTPLYNIHKAVVFSNEQNVFTEGGITYMPIYYAMFVSSDIQDEELIIPDIPLPTISM